MRWIHRHVALRQRVGDAEGRLNRSAAGEPLPGFVTRRPSDTMKVPFPSDLDPVLAGWLCNEVRLIEPAGLKQPRTRRRKPAIGGSQLRVTSVSWWALQQQGLQYPVERQLPRCTCRSVSLPAKTAAPAGIPVSSKRTIISAAVSHNTGLIFCI
jgi:hypothetical protein